MDLPALLLSAMNTQFPGIAVAFILAVSLMFLFWQLKATRVTFSAENAEMATRITEVAAAVKECSTSHDQKSKTLSEQFTAFQVCMAQTTPTRDEMDKRFDAANQAKMEVLGGIRDDIKFLKETLLRTPR